MLALLINKIKTMAKINEMRAIPKDDKSAVIEALINYKRQNPVKFEAKKEALFAKYGLSLDTPVEAEKDETDLELEKIKKQVKSKKTNE